MNILVITLMVLALLFVLYVFCRALILMRALKNGPDGRKYYFWFIIPGVFCSLFLLYICLLLFRDGQPTAFFPTFLSCVAFACGSFFLLLRWKRKTKTE